MSALERAWSVLKAENTAEQKSAIIECLKREGGAASLEDCCKAAKMSKEDCKSLINTMDNVKIHDSGDVVLMDGLWTILS